MNISYRWLQAIAPSITDSPEQLAERLGMLGAPVDDIADLSAGLQGLVVARVEGVRPHPNADRLRLCTVAAGGEPLQVVCGAPNVEVGGYYPFAPVGASLPGGMVIKKAKLRGETSEGMLCSAREIGLGRDHAGILALHGEWSPGTPLVPAIGLDDTLLVLDITPNRPDLLSHVGVARELASGGNEELNLPTLGDQIALEVVRAERKAESEGLLVRIEDAEGCARYMAAVIEGVKVGPSPEWLASRLRAVGVRPINNVVDATNYVLYEVGQPLHAFDLDRLAGPEIQVRGARPGEVLKTLDGVERTLDESALVIADQDNAVALAGIMGGEDSEVTEGTTRILLECALFDPLRVRKTARGLALSTDASHRFERGVDPEGQPQALRRVAELILAVAGGSLRGPAVDVHPSPLEGARIQVREARVAQVLGIELASDEIARLLRPIGFQSEPADGAAAVSVPSYRPDVTREIDVIEEIARRRGYDSFESELSRSRPGNVPADSLLGTVGQLHSLFERWGLLEARTAAFAPAADERVPLLNPLSSEESHLRDALIDGLLRRIEHNWAHGVRGIRLYEIGSVFQPNGDLPREELHFAAAMTGPSRPSHWSGPDSPWDIWDLKGLLEDIGRISHAHVQLATGDGSPGTPLLNRLEVRTPEGESIGIGGEVDLSKLDAPAWADPVFALEFVLRPWAREPHRYEDLPSFPAVERDLALLTPTGVTATQVEAVLRASGGDLLERVWPFDLYEGEGIPGGTRSVAWRLRFRHRERTLTDDEVDKVIARVLNSLEEAHGVRRR